MTRKQFLAWGAQWHHPKLLLAPDRSIKHGKDAYEAASPVEVRLASKRIDLWNARVAPTQAHTNVMPVESMVKQRHVSNMLEEA